MVVKRTSARKISRPKTSPLDFPSTYSSTPPLCSLGWLIDRTHSLTCHLMNGVCVAAGHELMALVALSLCLSPIVFSLFLLVLVVSSSLSLSLAPIKVWRKHVVYSPLALAWLWLGTCSPSTWRNSGTTCGLLVALAFLGMQPLVVEEYSVVNLWGRSWDRELKAHAYATRRFRRVRALNMRWYYMSCVLWCLLPTWYD